MFTLFHGDISKAPNLVRYAKTYGIANMSMCVRKDAEKKHWSDDASFFLNVELCLVSDTRQLIRMLLSPKEAVQLGLKRELEHRREHSAVLLEHMRHKFTLADASEKRVKEIITDFRHRICDELKQWYVSASYIAVEEKYTTSQIQEQQATILFIALSQRQNLKTKEQVLNFLECLRDTRSFQDLDVLGIDPLSEEAKHLQTSTNQRSGAAVSSLKF